MNPQVNPKAQRRGILARVRDVFTIPAHAPPMPGKMKAGLLVLWLLTGFIVLVLGQNLLYLVLSKVSGKEAFLPVFVLFYGFPLPIFMSACLLLVRRGYRAPAILCLLVPVFLFLPPSIIIFTGGILVPLEYFGIIKTSIDSFGQLQNWIVRPLLVAVLIAATPLAFGARAEEWYRQC
ncbi:MAG: hypothetical protein LBP52_03430, partial [Burkholderiaceae bacterium]|nr:hypothetical protein [Burkholderiaceae bacterium]